MSNGFEFGMNEAVLPSIESLGSDFLAPYALSLFISALETGIIILCFSRFLARRADVEPTPIKLLVYFLTFASLFQTAMTFAAWWKIFVVDFGNWNAAGVPSWPQKIHTSMTTLLAAPVQLFLIWRCWHALKRRWFIALPLVLLVIGTVITTIYVTAILFRIQFASVETLAVELNTFFACFAVCLALSAATDISVTSILLVFLFQSRSKVYTRKFRKVLSQLISITWESAVPPCACALAAFIACMRGAPFVSYWAVMLQTVLGKLYVISLFVTLEARSNLADVANPTHFPTLTNTARIDRTWSVSAAQDEYDNTDPTQGSHQPVRLSLGVYKLAPADDTALEGSSSADCPPPVVHPAAQHHGMEDVFYL